MADRRLQTVKSHIYESQFRCIISQIRNASFYVITKLLEEN